MNKGRLIAFEGIEDCGKTAQSRILTERLKALLLFEPVNQKDAD